MEELLKECKKVLTYYDGANDKLCNRGYLVKATKRLLSKLDSTSATCCEAHRKERLKLQLEICMLTGVLADYMDRKDIKQLLKELHK